MTHFVSIVQLDGASIPIQIIVLDKVELLKLWKRGRRARERLNRASRKDPHLFVNMGRFSIIWQAAKPSDHGSRGPATVRNHFDDASWGAFDRLAEFVGPLQTLCGIRRDLTLESQRIERNCRAHGFRAVET